MQIVTRQQALSQGLKRYFTGIPCKRGHLSEQRVGSGACVECSKTLSRRHYLANRDDVIQRSVTWATHNPKKVRGADKLWKSNNSDKIAQSNRAYKKKHRARYNAHGSKYRAAKLQAIPPWADLEAIKAFYEACPKGYHVDHIIPLNSKVVCGLHVIENLQYLTGKENSAKGNKFMPELAAPLRWPISMFAESGLRSSHG